METLFDELEARLRNLHCVPALMAWYIEGKAEHEFTPEQLRVYLDRNLSFVEREIAPVGDSRFWKLCESLEQVDEVGLTAALKIRGDFDYADCWLDFAQHLQDSPAECLYCLASHFAQPDPELWENDDLMTWSLTLLAGTFRVLGKQADGVRLLEDHAGLSPADYASPSTLRERLLVRVDEEGAAIYGLALADLLVLVDRHRDAVTLLEALVWLEEGDYSDMARLRGKLRTGLEERGEANNVAYYVTTLAEALFFVRRHPDGLSLLQAYTHLGEAEGNPAGLRAMLQSGLGRGLKPHTVNPMVRVYASALGFAGKYAESVQLLESHLGLEMKDYASEASLREKLGAGLSKRLPANHAAACAIVFSKVLRQQGRLRDAARVLVAHLGLPEAEATGERLGERLNALREGGLEGNNLANYAEALAEAYRFLYGPEAAGKLKGAEIAVQILEGHLGLRREHYESASLLGQALGTAFSERVTANNAATYLKSLGKALGSVGRQQDAVHLLEAHAGLTATDYDGASRLRDRIRDGLGKTLTPNNAATFVVALADSLGDVPGRQPDRLCLLEAHAGMEDANYANSDWLVAKLRDLRASLLPDTAATYVRALADALNGTRPRDAGRLLDSYLSHLLGPQEGAQLDILPANLCYLMNRWLHHFGTSHSESLTACRRFVPQLRRNLSNHWMAPEERWRFVERFSEVRQRIAQIGHHWAARERDPARATQLRLDAYCWDAELGQRLLLQRFLLGVSVLTGDEDAAAPVNRPAASPERLARSHSRGESGLGCFGVLAGQGDDVSTEPDGPRAEIAPPAWCEMLDKQLEMSVEPRHLAESLLPSELLLRATFAADGQLVWNAFRRDGEGCLLFVADDGGRGRPGDREALHAAVSEHDRALDAIWGGWNRFGNELSSFISRIDGLLEKGEFEFWADDWSSLVEVAAVGGFEDLIRRLKATFGPDVPTPDARFAEAWARFWRETVDLYARRPCEEATGAHLRNVARIWDLAALAEGGHLTPETDLVLQVDDVLHAVPVAYLPIGDHRLLERVASVRTVLSPLASALQRRSEEEAEQTDPQPTPRLVAVSSFGRGDAAAYGAAWLHKRLRGLAGCECAEAFDDPPGSLRALAAGLQGRPRRVAALVTCGHGDADRAGVELADVLWNGRYCDLSPADLVVQVSCSVGRNSQGGLKDVEGFCVELTVHRARSVLAGRWQLNSQESSRFAAAVIEEYLRSRTAPVPRARAVNRVARHFMDRAPGEVGLNTLAAFELYGLG